MLLWFFSAVCIVASVFVTLGRVMPLKVIFGYATIIDIVFTVVLLFLFHGSLTGTMSATLAGLMMALFLSTSRYFFGTARYKLSRRGWVLVETEGCLARIELSLAKIAGDVKLYIQGVRHD